jgi:hypothetical protein
MASRFVCAADEAFFLGPPAHFKEEWLPDRESTRLFQTYKRNAPPGVIPDGPTVQGVYCMTADGDYLSGHFARVSREAAVSILGEGWQRWERLARQRGYQSKPVPQTALDPALGKPLPPGGLKLEAAVRDLPRGQDAKPGRQEWQRCAYNLNWIDLTPEEARSFVTAEMQKQPVPAAVLERLTLKTLKDAVRGQCSDWQNGALKEGQLDTQCIRQEADRLTMRLTGFARLEQSGRAYACRFHGKVVYDTRSRRFLAFELVAAGQRSGRDQFNFREDDPGPAPMGVAYTLYRG